MSSRLPEYMIFVERDVFIIRDEYGEDVSPHRQFTSVADARAEIARLEREDLANFDGPDVPGFEAGFAENH